MMQRPRNRQGRGAAQINRARGGRWSGRRRGGDPQDDHRGLSDVPNISQVVPSSFVSIVLKVDQPTGREVQGVVADVLTSGNHPRGIKVRLVDGRIGRVQRMITEEDAKAGSDGLIGLRRNGEEGGSRFVARQAGRMRSRDEREDEETTPTSGYSLGDFLPLGHPLREENTTPIPDAEKSGPVSTCPVCGAFEGDEVAVSHHVNSHFE